MSSYLTWCPERPLVQHWNVSYQDTYGVLAGPSLYRLAFTPKATLKIPQPTWLPEPLGLRPCYPLVPAPARKRWE